MKKIGIPYGDVMERVKPDSGFSSAYRRLYEQEQNKAAVLADMPDRADGKPDFNKWLYARSGHTCGELYQLALFTGSTESYNKMMEWYENRYIIEQQNPFVRT